MGPLRQPPDNLRFLVCRGVRVLLASQCNNDTSVVLLMLWQLVRVLLRSGFNPGPLSPQIDTCGRLDQFYDIGTTHASSSFEKGKGAILVPFDEFHVGDSCHPPNATG